VTETHYYEKLFQEDVNFGVGVGTKRNPGGGQLTGTEIGIHSMAVGQAQVSGTWDPPSVNSLGTTTTMVTVPGASLGDKVMVSFSLSLGGLMMFAEVTATNTVTVTLFNPTTAAIDLGSGTLSVLVLKSR
jgi:hypothetical protein